MLCPVPIIRLARAAGSLPAGSLIELRTDDPAAVHDVPAWCRLRGHQLVLTEPLSAEVPDPMAMQSSAASGPEPHTPNEHPGQALRHLIRLGAPSGPPGSPSSPALA